MLGIANSKVIGGPGIWTPGATVIGGGALNFEKLIAKLFANNEQGFFYDPNDLSTMFQDAAGTVPVTAAGRPVGLMLDKSKGLVLGGELFPITVVARANTSVEYIDNKIKITCTAAGSWGIDFTYNASTVSGYFYKVVGNLIIATSQQAYLRLVTGQATIRSSGLINTIERSSGTSSGALGLISGSVGEYVELELSVKHIAGNHAYQTTSASRPILQYSPTLGSELLANGGFSNGLTGWTATGTLTFTASGDRAYYNGAGGSGSGNLASSDVLAVGKKYIVSYDYEVVQGSFNCGGTYQIVLGGRNITGKGRRVFEITVSDSRDKGVRFGPENTSAVCEFYIDNVSVKEITGYRTDQNYLKFDGVDDFLQTSNIDFTATDKVSLFAGVTKLADTGQIIAELSQGIAYNAGSFYFVAGTDAGGNGYVSMARGSSSVGIAAAARNFTYLAPDFAVLSIKHDISGNLSSMRRNGVIGIDGLAVKGTGNFGNYPLFIGRRAGTALPFNGHIYSLIGIGRLTTDSETAALEKVIAKNTGVTLNA